MTVITEAHVEKRLKRNLEQHGFKVLKFVTPGTAGGNDRLILWPTWSPAAPVLVELKRPNKAPRLLQSARAIDFIKRGMRVEPYVSTYDEVDALCERLLTETRKRYESYQTL